jgi:hypothetical protein
MRQATCTAALALSGRTNAVSRPGTNVLSVAVKVMKLMNLMNLMNLARMAQVAKIIEVEVMTTLRLSLSPQRDRAGLAC